MSGTDIFSFVSDRFEISVFTVYTVHIFTFNRRTEQSCTIKCTSSSSQWENTAPQRAFKLNDALHT